MKGQVSTELMVVVGFILLLFIPLMFVLYLKLGDVTTDLSVLQAHFSVIRIASLINAIGYMGDGSAIITEVYLPTNVIELQFRSFGDNGGGGEVVLVHFSHGEESDVSAPTAFQINLEDPQEGGIEIDQPGRYRLEILNVGGEITVRAASSAELRA